MDEYIKSSELCRRCKYSTKEAICDHTRHCDGCGQNDDGNCRCSSIKLGEPCPYFTHPFGVWISVKDDLPRTDEMVLVIASGKVGNTTLDNALELAEFSVDEGWILEMFPEWEDPKVTHWMPLPELPDGYTMSLGKIDRPGDE